MGKKNSLDKFYTVTEIAQNCISKTEELVGLNFDIILLNYLARVYAIKPYEGILYNK